jgi:hypothetical protein
MLADGFYKFLDLVIVLKFLYFLFLFSVKLLYPKNPWFTEEISRIIVSNFIEGSGWYVFELLNNKVTNFKHRQCADLKCKVHAPKKIFLS